MQVDSKNSIKLSSTLYVSELEISFFFEKANVWNETAWKLWLTLFLNV